MRLGQGIQVVFQGRKDRVFVYVVCGTPAPLGLQLVRPIALGNYGRRHSAGKQFRVKVPPADACDAE